MKKNITFTVFSYFVIVTALFLLTVVSINLLSAKRMVNLAAFKTVDQALASIKTQGIKDYDTAKLNQLLQSVQKTTFTGEEKAKIKREIIREYGFTNFDWKGTLGDVTAFQDSEIEILELKEPMIVYRRGYPLEPSSKFGLGRWWSDKSRTIEEAREDLAILENWGNPLSAEYKIQIPQGSRVLVGVAAPQEFKDPTGKVLETRKGGGLQYFIETVKNEWLQP
jgi:hypothetical protein